MKESSYSYLFLQCMYSALGSSIRVMAFFMRVLALMTPGYSCPFYEKECTICMPFKVLASFLLHITAVVVCLEDGIFAHA